MAMALQTWQRWASGLGGRLTDLLLPPGCLICRARLAAPASLCPSCWSNLSFIEAPVCERLGLPFPFDPGAGAVSPAALNDPPPWHRARAAVAFDDRSRRLVHALKYYDQHEVAGLMARMMARAGRALLDEADVILPVPLHRRRLWSRRYNQSALLAADVARFSGRRFEAAWLQRTRPTAQQVGLDHRARRKNVRGAFAVRPEHTGDVHGRKVVLVDDVMTTGATAGACSRALVKAGAAQVDIVVFALACDPRKLDIVA